MDIMYSPKEMERVATSRDSFSGRLLSDPHYDEAMMITGIIEKEIQSTGRFKKALEKYSEAYVHDKKNLSVIKSETLLRDLFKDRTGMTMNEMRETFVQREENLTDEQRKAAFPYAMEVGTMIEQGDKVSFHRAFSHQAKDYATKLNITDLGAKRLMSQQFEAVKGEKFYDWGKEQEKTFYRPQIEAQKQRSAVARSQTRESPKAQYSR